MRYRVVNLGGLLEDYQKEWSDFKERFRPKPGPPSPTPPPASAPSAAGIDPANKICAILRAWKEEMEQAQPNVAALTEYQKAFNEVANGMNEDARQGAEQLIKKFCPDAASLYQDFQLRYQSQRGGRRNPPPPVRPDVPTVDPFRGGRGRSGSPPPQPPPPSPPLPPVGPDTPTFDRYRGGPPAGQGPVARCPAGQFWDGRQCRGSVSTSYGGMMPYASMTGAGIPARPVGIVAPSAQRFLRS